MRRFAALIFAVVIAVAAATPSVAADSVVVASKIDTEGALLGNIVVLLLRGHGIAVDSRLQLGPTQIVRQAILAGQIDLYPEYTGNGAFFFARESDPAWRDPEAGYALVKQLDRAQHDLVWLAPAPADNSWAIATRRNLAAAQHLTTLEDLARYVNGGGKLRLAASAEFVDSPGALPAFEAAYGFKLARDQRLVLVGGDTSATLRAAGEGISGVNAAMAYATDGALAVLQLQLLADDKHAQTVYEPAPVIRGAVLMQHPEIERILDPVFRSLSLERLQQLNARIAADGEQAAAVAAAYLHANGFAP
ncbi:MAG TPA: glycine betaine ABC transporter substrate-binding protein [Stellaceae bacterium]|nr:glycine betaine ABC transporter substrate-binding protein [Stellaceae bacterium]